MTGEVLLSTRHQTDKQEKIHACVFVTVTRNSYLCLCHIAGVQVQVRERTGAQRRNQNRETRAGLMACCRKRNGPVPVFEQIPTWSIVSRNRQNSFNRHRVSEGKGCRGSFSRWCVESFITDGISLSA